MNSERLDRLISLFHEAVDLAEPERKAYIREACGSDEELRAELLVMIRADGPSGSLLDSSLASLASQMLTASPTLSDVPARFGPYSIKELIGEGGMGVVYLAERDDLGSLAAIKVLRDHWLSPARRERFIREQRTLAQLNHPAIATIFDSDTLPDGTPWFAMEYVEGVPVTDFCRERLYSVEERLKLFRAVCEAVQFAHRHAIIHRDLKPSNILVTSEGRVKLLDFGIARQVENDEQWANRTRTGLGFMTPAYAAPEQIRSEREGVFTDVYSLGLILYEFLAGRLPFDLSTRTPSEAVTMILGTEPEKPSVKFRAGQKPGGRAEALTLPGKGAWADLDVMCLKAIHSDPQRRYQSVEALIRDVDHYLKDERLEARPDQLSYRIAKFTARNRRVLGAAALALLGLVCLVTFYTWRLAKARDTAVATEVRLQRVQGFMLNLFQGGDKTTGPDRNLRVIDLVDNGVKEAEALQQEPEAQAQLYGTLGGIYQKLGNLGQADALLNSALNKRRSLFGNDHPEVAESLVALGMLRVEQAKFDDAERLIREGLEKTVRVSPRDDRQVARATRALGKVLTARGQYEKAIPVLEEAARIESGAGSDKLELAATLNELADAHFYLGHYDVCEDLTRQAMSIYRRSFGDNHPLVADGLINLGAVHFERGRYAESERYYRQALGVDAAWFGEDNEETASTLSMLGRALIFEQRFDEAVPLEERALAIRERVLGPEHPRVANVLNELASVAMQRNRLDEAEMLFRRVQEIYRKAYGEHHYLYALSLGSLASVDLRRNQYVRAEKLCRESVVRFTEALSATHPYTGIAQLRLGRALLRQKRYAEAASHSLTGYQILMKQTSPSLTWLQSAREDLASDYAALGEPEKAARFLEEAARTGDHPGPAKTTPSNR